MDQDDKAILKLIGSALAVASALAAGCIPSGYNGIPLVKTLDQHEPPSEKGTARE